MFQLTSNIHLNECVPGSLPAGKLDPPTHQETLPYDSVTDDRSPDLRRAAVVVKCRDICLGQGAVVDADVIDGAFPQISATSHEVTYGPVL